MGTVQVIEPVESETISNPVQTFVRTKLNWLDDWQVNPYVQPIMLRRSIAPTISSADFIFHYGEIAREDRNTFSIFSPLDSQNFFIQVVGIDEVGEFPLWTGIITDEEFDIQGTVDTLDPQGDQFVRAYGLEFLLDRKSVDGAFVEENSVTQKIGWSPTFNKRQSTGLSLLGNMSSLPTSNKAHVFSKDAEVWTHLKIADYLLEFFPTNGPVFKLSGQFELLDPIQRVIPHEGLTIFQILNKLVDRRRGLGWAIRTSGEDDVNIHIFSVLKDPVSVGQTTIPPNLEQFELRFDDAIDIVKAITKLSNAGTFDKIIVQGQRLKACFSPSFDNGILEPAWTQEEQDAYDAATDEERATDKFNRVYEVFRIRRDWDWKIFATSGGGGSGFVVPVNPKILDDGSIDFDAQQNFWNYSKSFLRQLPIEKEALIANSEPEFNTPFVLVDTGDGKLHHVERLSNVKKKPGRVRMLDREMAIEVKMEPNHTLALNHFVVETSEISANNPEIDFETILATVFIETDERIHVIDEIQQDRRPENERVLVIDIPDAESWLIIGGTTLSITNGVPVLQADSELVRDDTPRLREIAALAKAWYSNRRAAVELKIKAINPFAELGSLMTTASSSWHIQQVGTVVSQIIYDFKAGTTRIQTDYGELDFANLSRESGGGGFSGSGPTSPRELHRTINEMDKSIKELNDKTAEIAQREPIGSGGGDPVPTEVRWISFQGVV